MKSFTEEEILEVEKETHSKRSFFSAKLQIKKNQELILDSYNNKGFSCLLIWKLLKKRNEFTRNYTSFLRAFNELYKNNNEEQKELKQQNNTQIEHKEENTQNKPVLSIQKKTFNFNSLANKDDLI